MPFSLILLLSALASQPESPSLPIHVGGRVERLADGSLRFGWPGIYFESRFHGTGVTVAVESSTEHMRILVDGEEKAVLREPGTTTLTFTGLADGQHRVRLEKLTESQSGGGRLLGIYAAPASTPLDSSARGRAIEFIGDSHTVGYGNMSNRRECTREEVHDLTNTQRAFGPLLARRLGADYRISAYSGFGIVRNYGGSQPDLNLPAIYDRMIPGQAAPLDSGSDAWRPDLVVINLGTNDFSTELKPGEKWSSGDDLRADYRRSYHSFLRKLMDRQAQAKFVLVASGSFVGEVRAVAAMLTPEQRVRVAIAEYPALDLIGCDWHPSLGDHRALAMTVADVLGPLGLDWEPTQPAPASAQLQ